MATDNKIEIADTNAPEGAGTSHSSAFREAITGNVSETKTSADEDDVEIHLEGGGGLTLSYNGKSITVGDAQEDMHDIVKSLREIGAPDSLLAKFSKPALGIVAAVTDAAVSTEVAPAVGRASLRGLKSVLQVKDGPQSLLDVMARSANPQLAAIAEKEAQEQAPPKEAPSLFSIPSILENTF